MVVSALYESPPNRQRVDTAVIEDDARGRAAVQDAIKEELAAGGHWHGAALGVCPCVLIECMHSGNSHPKAGNVCACTHTDVNLHACMRPCVRVHLLARMHTPHFHQSHNSEPLA